MKAFRKILDAALTAKFGRPLVPVGDKTDDVFDPDGNRIGLRSNKGRCVITLAEGPGVKDRIKLTERTKFVAFVVPGLRGADAESYLVPSPRIETDWQASHQWWTKGKTLSSISKWKMRELRMDGDPAHPTRGFAVKYAQYKLPSPQALPFVQRGPSGLDLVSTNEAFWIAVDDENRGYCGTHRDIAEQLRDDNINTDQVRGATLEDYISGVLNRMGITAPPTPEIMIGAMCARGALKLYPPGAKLF